VQPWTVLPWKAAEKVNFAVSAPKGASDFEGLTVSVMRYPDTKPDFFRKLLVLLCYTLDTFGRKFVSLGFAHDKLRVMSANSVAPGAQQKRFAAYLDRLAHAAGHLDRVVPLKSYGTGLLLPGERKSVEPMAARLCPDNVRQTHQSLHHVVAHAPWSDEDCWKRYASTRCLPCRGEDRS